MREWICSWLRHKLVDVQSFENGSRKMLCKRCKQYYCLNTKYEVFVEWTPILDSHYVEMTGSRTIV